MNKVLVISVHPDDETLGCGGTILKHKKNGDKIYCSFVTSGNKSQKKTIKIIAKKYDFDDFMEMNFEELTLEDISLNELVPAFADIFNKVKPEILYIPNRSDVHSHHRKIFSAVIAASKSFRTPFIKRLLMCEVISETEFAPALPENSFIPNVFVDISEYFDTKIDVMKIYKSEIMEDNFPRSINAIKALASFRGSRIGVKYAEAFTLLYEKM